MRFLFIAIIALILISCKKDNIDIIVQNGVKIYNNKIPSNKKLEIKVNKIFEIDCTNDSSNSPFIKYVMGFCADESNNIFITDAFAGNVHAYDSKGQYIKTFGRRGQGPGEMMYPKSIISLNDTLIISDNGVHKLHIYDTEGNFIKQIKYNHTGYSTLLTTYDKFYVANFFNMTKNTDKKKFELSSWISLFDNNLADTMNIESYSKEFTDYDQIDFRMITQSCCSRNYFYIGSNDYDKYNISVYNNKLIKISEIRKRYAAIKLDNTESVSLVELSKNTSFPFDEKAYTYHKAIKTILVDNQEILWVMSPKKDNEKNNKGLKFDIFKGNLYLNTVFVKFDEEDYGYISDIEIKLFSNKLYVLNESKNKIAVYDFKYVNLK